MINVFQPSLGKEELAALEKVFESNWIGKGKRVAEFEEKYAEHIKSSKDLVLTTTCCMLMVPRWCSAMWTLTR